MASGRRRMNLGGGRPKEGEVSHGRRGSRFLRGLKESREREALREGLFHTCVFDGGLRG
jgi:hypothetical protein